MKSQPPRSMALLLILPLLLPMGCAPKSASVEEESKTSEATSPAPVPSGEAGASGDQANNAANFGFPRNPAEMGKMDTEDIETILAGMSPDEHTTVILRFVSLTLLFFYAVFDRFPTPEEGLDILLNPPPAPDGKAFENPFARDILLLDAWGQRIVYEPITLEDGQPFFSLKSLGEDGVEGNDDRVPEPDFEKVTLETAQRIAAGELDKMGQ
jgi:hypothetical protein